MYIANSFAILLHIRVYWSKFSLYANPTQIDEVIDEKQDATV